MFKLFILTIALLQLGGIVASSEQESKFVEAPQEDRALLQSVPCPYAAGPLNYFQLEIAFIAQGGFDTSECEEKQKEELGKDINRLLLDYGIGEAGEGDGVVHLLAEVCVDPEETKFRRQLRLWGYTYRGGGACRYCKNDNRDGRRLEKFDLNWFGNIYAPELENTLRNAITNTVARAHTICLGNGPQVLVDVTPVREEEEVNTSC